MPSAAIPRNYLSKLVKMTCDLCNSALQIIEKDIVVQR